MSDEPIETPAGATPTIPLWVGLYGPTGGGKTLSAIRLGVGMQRVMGGSIYYIDTESGRALHYRQPRGQFDFEHRWLRPPFCPLEYLAAIKRAVTRGARVVIIDTFSHEHDGEGGILEQWEAEIERRVSKKPPDKREAARHRVKWTAWIEPKARRRKLLSAMLQMPVSFILCWRAKEKLEIVAGKDPVQLGWMPVASSDYVHECMVCGLLVPGANGVPTWTGTKPGERLLTKHPLQFQELLRPGLQINEDMGEAMAKWANGAPAPAADPGPPDFSASFQWTGLEQWGGKPLDAAPVGDVAAYADALRAVVGKASPQKAERITAHLGVVEAVLRAASEQDAEGDADGSADDQGEGDAAADEQLAADAAAHDEEMSGA